MYFPTLNITTIILLSVLGLVGLLTGILITGLFLHSRNQHPLWQCILLALQISASVLCIILSAIGIFNLLGPITDTDPTESIPPSTTLPTEPTMPSTEQTQPTEPPATEPAPFDAGMTAISNPDLWGIRWDILINNDIITEFSRNEEIFFSDPNDENYFSLPGIATFRGDNYRTGAVYGTVEVNENTLNQVWAQSIGALEKGTGTGSWSGCGWTGQPLIVQWDARTRQIMNLYDDKKQKDGLTEVIYATLDGNIYFLDLDDGSYTRDPMYIGMAFKGAGALDPRGYPLLYVGSGDKTASGKPPRMFVISLIDCTILYEYGNSDMDANRSWCAFDSAPLIDRETDTLIWPGENGVLYTVKLNTAYNKEAGSLTVSPDQMVKTRYQTDLGRTLGYEASAIIVQQYIYIADNGGMLFCVDINSMALVWAQNLKDDCNATPVFEWGTDGRGFLYCGTSVEYTGDTAYLYKINAATGEILWEKKFSNIAYDKAVSGGVLSSPVLGKKGSELDGMILYSIAKTPTSGGGILVALGTDTGEILWQCQLQYYCWSSPSAIYDEDGTAHLILCDSQGNVMLIDPSSGDILTSISLGSNIEASPAIFDDLLVVGTRGMRICGVKIS